MIVTELPFAKLYEPTVKTLHRIAETHELRPHWCASRGENDNASGRPNRVGERLAQSSRSDRSPHSFQPCPSDRAAQTAAEVFATPFQDPASASAASFTIFHDDGGSAA